MFSVAGIISGISVGPIARKIGNRPSFILGILFSIAGLIIMPFAPNLLVTLLPAFLFGASMTFLFSTAYTIAAGLIPEDQRGRLFGFYNAAFFISFGLGGTVLTGPITDFVRTLLLIQAFDLSIALAYAYRVAFIAAAIVTVIGTFLFLLGWLMHGYRPRLLKSEEEIIVTETSLDVMPKAP